jgi:hypothetical protein
MHYHATVQKPYEQRPGTFGHLFLSNNGGNRGQEKTFRTIAWDESPDGVSNRTHAANVSVMHNGGVGRYRRTTVP